MKNTLSVIIFSSLVVVSACRGSQASGPEAQAPTATPTTSAIPTAAGGGVPPSRKYETCAPSSVSQHTSCPARVAPPSNASSDYGCKTDAECTNGRDGRCVKNENHVYGMAPSPEARRSNLLAGPMAPPPKTLCVYDKCQSDGECGSGMRCNCGSGKGQERNQCIAVDTCLTDKDCGPEALCSCGTSPAPNTCKPGNCRTNSECGAGFACEQYCRSARDACRTHADCKAPTGMYPVCIYLPETHAFGCRAMHPPPAG